MTSKKLQLTYIGIDSHSRPVYEDKNGNLWKDTDPRSHVPPSIYSAYRNAFDGEPDVPIHVPYTLLPKRKTW